MHGIAYNFKKYFSEPRIHDAGRLWAKPLVLFCFYMFVYFYSDYILEVALSFIARWGMNLLNKEK